MAFFTNSGGVKVGTITTSKSTYASGDYYIAEYTGSFKIEGYDNDKYKSHDTSIANGSGPEDYYSYYGNKNAAKLFISHVPTGYAVAFPAILEAYAESFKPSFTPEHVYGRMDPIQRYQHTSRTISVSWKVLAYDENHAHRNLHALSALTEFLYPIYDKDGVNCSNATVIREAPLLRIRFANLIQRNARTGDETQITSYIKSGLLVAPTDFSFTPNLEAGFFFEGTQAMFPKEIKISMAFSVLHEETPGWIWSDADRYDWIGKLKDDGAVNNTNTDFPWGNDKSTATATAAGVTSATVATNNTTGKSSIDKDRFTSLIQGRESLDYLITGIDQVTDDYETT